MSSRCSDNVYSKMNVSTQTNTGISKTILSELLNVRQLQTFSYLGTAWRYKIP